MSTHLPTTEAEKQAFFANIVAQYSERLYWTVRRIVIDHDDADDVLQNVFVKAWSNIDDFQNRSKNIHMVVSYSCERGSRLYKTQEGYSLAWR